MLAASGGRNFGMLDVFLSYNREDLRAATRLVERLRATGLGVWWDADIPPDAPWEATIEQALAEARVVLVCWSRAAVASDNVRSEARWAREQGRLMQAFVEPCSPPLFFGERQGVDLSDWSGDPADPRFARLVTAIRSRLGEAASAAARPPPPLAKAPAQNSWPSRPRPPRRLWIAAAAVLVLAAALGAWFARGRLRASPAAQRVAVLPFEPIGAAPELSEAAENLSDNLQSVLTLGQIETVSRSDAESLRGPGQDRRLRALGVGLLYDGTVRRDGDNLAVRVHLDDPLQHATLWSAEISAPASTTDPLQAQVAARTVAVLQCAAKMLHPSGGLADAPSRSLYLHACDLLETQGWGDDVPAIFALQDTLKQLTTRAPSFAAGHAMFAYALAGYIVMMPADQVARVRVQATAEAQRALALDPKDVTARHALYALLPPHDFAGRKQMLDAALEADPASPAANGETAWFLTNVGRLQDALPFAQKATAANPLTLDYPTFMLLAWLGQTDEANLEVGRLLEHWPDSSKLWYSRVLIDQMQGRWDDALAVLNDPRGRLKTFDEAALAYQRASIDALKSRDPAKLQAVREAIWGTVSGTPTSGVGTLGMPSETALLARLGFIDDALRFGARYAASATFIGDEPDVDTGVLFSPLGADLRRDPRFIGLAAQLGLLDYWRSTGKWPDFCAEPGLSYDCRAEAAKLSKVSVAKV